MAYSKLVHMFSHAYDTGVKWPTIKLESPVGRLKLYRATNKSRAPGSIAICCAFNHQMHNMQFVGRIDVTGAELRWYQTPDGVNVTNEMRRDIQQAINQFRDSPQAVATAYGHATNTCMFCGRPLNESFSVKHGYGPVCAIRWALPHAQNETGSARPFSKQKSIINDATRQELSSAFDL